MNPPLHLRHMNRADLSFADRLRAIVGWNQTMRDWQRLLAWEPDGCFVAEWEGAPAGTATTTSYGRDLAWIGMVLVHPDYRRRGIGKALLVHCLDHLRRREIGCIKLDATPLGKPLYTQLGFDEEWSLTRWETTALTAAPPMAAPNTRPWQATDAEGVAKLDRQAFGVARGPRLTDLMAGSRHTLVCPGENGRVNGFGMLRDGARATYLGPIAAASAEAGTALIESLLAFAGAEQVFWDIPDLNVPAKTLAEKLGFTPQRPLVRMALGQNAHPGSPTLQFAIADPAIG